MLKDFFYSLMTDKTDVAYEKPLKSILYIVSLAYGLAIMIRKALYSYGVFKRHKAPLCVVSVGNLTLGGTGKTPFVIELAKILSGSLKRTPAVLIRGYGWDEQVMLKNNLPDIPILVGEDRYKSSRRAVKLYGSDIAVLDDGFQHWELERDLDIVLLDSRKPFGNGRLFPRGVLREGEKALERADVVALTKVNKGPYDLSVLKKKVLEINKNVIFVEAVHRPRGLFYAKQNTALELSHIMGKRVVLLSSIGDPLYFEETVKDLGAIVAAHITFPDHHNYGKKDIERVRRICGEKSFESIVTTEKDAVKLNRLGIFFKDYKVLTLLIEMDIINGKESLIDRLHSLYTC